LKQWVGDGHFSTVEAIVELAIATQCGIHQFPIAIEQSHVAEGVSPPSHRTIGIILGIGHVVWTSWVYIVGAVLVVIAVLVLDATQSQGARKGTIWRWRSQGIGIVPSVHLQGSIEGVLPVVDGQIVVHIGIVEILVAAQSSNRGRRGIRVGWTRLATSIGVLLVRYIADIVQREGMVLGTEVQLQIVIHIRRHCHGEHLGFVLLHVGYRFTGIRGLLVYDHGIISGWIRGGILTHALLEVFVSIKMKCYVIIQKSLDYINLL